MTEKDINKIVAKLDVGDRVMLAWLADLSDWGLDDALEKKGIATKPIVARATKDGAVEFDKRNALRCRVYHAPPTSPARSRSRAASQCRPSPVPGTIRSRPEPTCNAHPKPKEKTDAKSNKGPQTREPKTTIKTLAGQIGTLAEQMREMNARLNNLVAYDKEKGHLREEVQGAQSRLESANEQAIAATSRGKVLADIVDRLLGRSDALEIPERLRNVGGDYTASHAPMPRGGRCGACGRF